MAAGLEMDAAEEFIYATLKGDATLMALTPSADVYNSQPDQGTVFPVIVYQFMSGIDYAAVGAIRIWSSMIYLVKVVGQTANVQDLKAAVARIDVLLHRASGTAADGTIWASVREQTISLPPDMSNGQIYHHRGALYRVYAS